jgi:hypothetical protein
MIDMRGGPSHVYVERLASSGADVGRLWMGGTFA